MLSLATARRASGLHSGNVWLVRGKQLTRSIFVQTGISDTNRIEVVSGDVHDGDELAVAALAPKPKRRLF